MMAQGALKDWWEGDTANIVHRALHRCRLIFWIRMPKNESKR